MRKQKLLGSCSVLQGSFQIANESKVWFMYSLWHYTTDLSRAFCLPETYIILHCLLVTLFLPVSYSLLFMVFHNTDPCLPIAFPYLSYFQQVFITADTVINTDVCVVEKQNQITHHSHAVTSGELCDIQRIEGQKCQDINQ